LLGVSYGAKVAGEYARRYPAQTAGLILDSPAPVDGLDGYDQLRTLGTPRVLREVCFPGLCHTTVRDPEAALAAATERLQDGAVRGPLVDRSGRVEAGTVRERDLYAILAASDLDPYLRAGLPAAIASLAEGDAAPLLHLTAVVPSDESEEDAINAARLLATSCIEGRLPWAPESPLASRADALAAFVAERAASFAPFSAATVTGSALTALCADWPPTPRPDSVSYAGPDVPVLVLSGRADLRTPLEDARRTAAQYPRAQVLAVPGVGHSVLTTDISGCALAGTVAFLRAQPVGKCSRTSNGARAQALAAPYAPAALGALRPTALGGTAGRTISAVTVTLTGIGFDLAASPPDGTTRYPGLRGGYVRGSGRSLQLVDVEWIRGVRVSGRLDDNGRGTLTVSGGLASGTITYTRSGARGVIGGRAFTLR
jgi:pimeloyl-ACP methyl ester carboxylesterase